MDKSTLETYISQGLSLGQISKITNKSRTSIRHWLKKFDLKTKNKSFKEQPRTKNIILFNGIKSKCCPKCKEVKNLQNEFYTSKNGDVHGWCKSCNNKITYEKQLARKVECVKYKGGKCIVCNYDKYIGALDFHHVNPEEKEFNIAQLRSYSLEFLIKELDKCVLLCKNCHAEVHHGLVDLKEQIKIGSLGGA
jgi:hypothetical protein